MERIKIIEQVHVNVNDNNNDDDNDENKNKNNNNQILNNMVMIIITFLNV